MYKFPYGETELFTHFASLRNKMTDEISEQIADKINAMANIDDLDSFNKRAAEFNGHSAAVEQFLGLPNVEELKTSFKQDLLNKTVDIVKSFNFTDQEAWAYVYYGIKSAGGN